MTAWNAEIAWQEMDRRNVSFFPSNPPYLAELLHVVRTKGRKPRQLRVCLSGGAPAPPALKRAYRDELGVYVIEGYGQSELGGFVAMGFPRPEPEKLLAAVGPTLPDREVMVMDEAGQEVPIGEPGEMAIRDSYMVGYWRKPEKTAEALRDGWLHTGDVGRMDREGYLYFLGRWSERIVSAGKIILPRPMEEVLYQHPAVQHVAVIGKPDKEAGELPKAVVSLYAGQSVTPEALLQHCQQVLGAENRLAEIEIIPEMPMTATGKVGKAEIQRREREKYQ
jgi:acyl-CoA synthetase (AMP-forming)/AMP-acid ligase II